MTKNGGQTNKKHQGKPSPFWPAVIYILSALKGAHDRTAAEHNERERHQANEATIARWAKIGGIFTIILAAVAFITACIFYAQYYAMMQANTDNREAFTAGQRAFLFVSETTVLPTITNDGKQTLRIFPKWMNSGDTPTKNLQIFSFCEVDANSFDFRNPKNPTADIIGPKQTKANGNCDAIPGTIELKSGIVGSFAVGAKAVYYDIFDRNIKHVSEFCATFPITQIYNARDGTVTMSAGGTFTYCPKHNCADDECPAEDR
jgi:hypothetical protein